MPTPQHLPTPLVAFVALFLSASLSAWIWAIGRLRRGELLLPQAPSKTVPWRIEAVIAVALLWMILNTLVPYLLHPLIVAPETTWLPSSAKQPYSTAEELLLIAIINALLVLLIPIYLAWSAKAHPSDIGISSNELGVNVLRGVVACLLIAPPVYFINFLAALRWKVQHHPLEQMVRDDPSGPIALLAVISGVILAPAAEELMFRGVLQAWLMRVWQGAGGATRATDSLDEQPVPGAGSHEPVVSPRPPRDGMMPILITSTIFAGIHVGQWPAPVAIFFLSLGLGFLYQRTGSLIGPFVLHAMFNGISTLGLFASLH